jgi:hypothetical protein
VGNNYDPSAWIINARDKNGHYERQWVNVMPAHHAQIAIILASKKFPYRSAGDLLRHAIVRHLQYLDAMEEFPSVTRQADLLNENLVFEQLQHECLATIEGTARIVAQHMSTGEPHEAARFVRKQMAIIAKMPDGFWKSRYTSEMNRRFAQLLGNSFTPDAEE